MQRTAALRARGATLPMAATDTCTGIKPHRLSASVIIAASSKSLPPAAVAGHIGARTSICTFSGHHYHTYTGQRIRSNIIFVNWLTDLSICSSSNKFSRVCALETGSSSTADDADYKICMLQRAAKSTFMPDVMVFPGGAVDSEDLAVAQALSGSADIGTVTAVAAAREAFEESGIVVAETPVALSTQACLHWRSKVHSDASQFVEFLREHDVAVGLGQLTPLCSFITPDMEHDRLPKGGFDARFYLHCCSDAATLAHAATDANETVKLTWLSPREALQASSCGEIFLAPPQWYILNDLAGCSRLAKLAEFMSSPAQALALDYPIKPFVATLDDADRIAGFESALCFPGDFEHPIYPGRAGERHRMIMAGKFGQEMKYALQRDDIKLPLKEAQSNWYQLAKL